MTGATATTDRPSPATAPPQLRAAAAPRGAGPAGERGGLARAAHARDRAHVGGRRATLRDLPAAQLAADEEAGALVVPRHAHDLALRDIPRAAVWMFRGNVMR